jgi:hypothetical protein
MDSYMSSIPNFPLSDPYSAVPLNTSYIHVNRGPVQTTTATVLATTGNNSIVDWVFVELRQGTSGATSVVFTKSALLQKDGDIVDMDGVSDLSFPNAPAGAYYITVRHRNHLGFRTDLAYNLSGTATVLNLTNNTVVLYGTYPLSQLSTTIFAMNGGDPNSDGSVDAVDSILWEAQNGLFDDYGNNADNNLDGSVDSIDSIVWEDNNGKYEQLD